MDGLLCTRSSSHHEEITALVCSPGFDLSGFAAAVLKLRAEVVSYLCIIWVNAIPSSIGSIAARDHGFRSNLETRVRVLIRPTRVHISLWSLHLQYVAAL